MAPDSPQKLLFSAQAGQLEDDIQRLLDLLQSSEIGEEYSAVLKSRLRLRLEPLQVQLKEVSKLLDEQDYGRAWELFDQSKRLEQRCQDTILEFLGGLTIREGEIDRRMASTTQSLLKDCATSVGVDWSPVVIISGGASEDLVEEASLDVNPGDSLVRIPAPRWIFWRLPLAVQALGYWIARYDPGSALKAFLDQEKAAVRSSYLWELAADAFATLAAGPAYVYALVFQEVDPTDPLAEADPGEPGGQGKPCDARRLAVCLRTLERMNEATRPNAFSPGTLTADLNRIQAAWDAALQACGNLDASRQRQAATQAWGDSLAAIWMGRFGSLAGQTAAQWEQAHLEMEPYFKNGLREATRASARRVVDGAWWCRARYPGFIQKLEELSWNLLDGREQFEGIGANEQMGGVNAQALLDSRLYDQAAEIGAVQDLFRSGKIPAVYREAAAGRFYRLLSEQDWDLGFIRRSVARGNPPGSSFGTVIGLARGERAQVLQQELLAFLGGIFMREKKLDQGACALADSLVRSLAYQAGVNWNGRVIPGHDPLFSLAVEYICLRFPDWDIWNLPLMVHELGHVTALASPQFSELMGKNLAGITQLPPASISGAWSDQEREDFMQRRTRHFHELFADAFAVYCLGPAFALNVILLHFDPRTAFAERGDHPTHAERVRALLNMLRKMNQSAEEGEQLNAPYRNTIETLKTTWNEAVSAWGAAKNELNEFYEIKAGALVDSVIYPFLQRNFRLGVQYQASHWLQSLEKATQLVETTCQRHAGSKADLACESLPDLLNIAWIGRFRNPECSAVIASAIRKVCEERGFTSSP